MEMKTRSVTDTPKKRAWIYCRIDGPDAFALRMQQELLNSYAQSEQLDVVGTTSEQRNGLSLMRDGIAEISYAAEHKEMDVLLVHKLNRLGRNSFEVLPYVRWLENHGVRVVCLIP